MAYSVNTDVMSFIKQVEIAATGDVDVQAEITVNITYADAIIDGKIAHKYSLPFATTPPLLKYISVALAGYFTLQSMFNAQIDDMPNWITEYYDKAMGLLDKIAACEINLVDASGSVITTFAKIRTNTSGKQPVFDLGAIFDQAYHSTDDDKRYGEGY